MKMKQKHNEQNKNDFLNNLHRWKFFGLNRGSLTDCKPMEGSNGCMCDGKTRCFAMSIDPPTGTGNDPFVD